MSQRYSATDARHWASGDVIANNIRIHYFRTGGDKPPVVLSHGFSDNGLCWMRVALELSRDYDVILYDQRGHGLSAAPETGYTAEDRAADLAGLIEVLHLEKPRALGHSMGAATVSTTAALYPNILRCAALEDPGWRAESASPTPAEREATLAQRRAEFLERKTKTRAQLIDSLRAEHPHWDTLEFGPWADAKLQMSMNSIQGFSLRANYLELVRKITCPILLITADPDKGSIVTPEVAQEVAGVWRRGRIVRINDSGHSIHRDQYEKFMEALCTFFAEV
jgi:N-formylmaleamate deformylase